MNTISKMVTSHFNPPAKTPDPAQGKDGAETLAAKNQKDRMGPSFPPSPNTQALGGHYAQDSVASSMPGFTETKLKRQSLEALVAVLRSLVVWGTGAGGGGLGTGPAGFGVAPPTGGSRTYTGSDGVPGSSRMSIEDSRGEEYGLASAVEPPGSLRNLSAANGGSNPSLVDDPGRFESAKQRKITFLEGVRKFNAKAKAVRSPSDAESRLRRKADH